MAWMKSETTGDWFLTQEFTHEKFTEFDAARAISMSLGFDSVTVPSVVILDAIARADRNRAQLVKDVADAVLAGITSGVTVTAAVDEAAIAAAVEARLSDEFAGLSADVNRPRTVS